MDNNEWRFPKGADLTRHVVTLNSPTGPALFTIWKTEGGRISWHCQDAYVQELANVAAALLIADAGYYEVAQRLIDDLAAAREALVN